MLKVLKSIIKNKALVHPSQSIRKVSELQPSEDIKFVIFDKDDTLVALDEFEVKDEETITMLKGLQERGIKSFVVSNSVTKKVTDKTHVSYKIENERREIEIIKTHNKKPFNGQEIESYLSKYENSENPKSIMIVGDRLLTDVYLGNIMGWVSVHTQPIEPTTMVKHGLGVFIMRTVEKYFL